MRHSILQFARASLVLVPTSLVLAACMGGASSQSDSAPKPSLLSGWFGSAAPAPTPVAAAPGPEAEPDCPSVDIREGGAVYRQNADKVAKIVKKGKAPKVEPTDETDVPDKGVKIQFTIKNVARECTFSGGTITLKIGIEGTALIGTSGRPGPASAPLTILVTRGDQTVASRAAVVNTVIPADEEQSQFRLVQGDIKVPPGKGEVSVTVGFNRE